MMVKIDLTEEEIRAAIKEYVWRKRPDMVKDHKINDAEVWLFTSAESAEWVAQVRLP